MKLPEPMGYHFKDDPAWNAYPGAGFCFKDALPKDAINVLPLFTEAQLREALAQQESVMRQALYVISAWDRGCEHDDYWRDCEEAINALEAALK